MADDDLDFLIRVRGGRTAASEVRAVESAFTDTTKAAKGTAAATDKVGESTKRTNNFMRGALGTTIRYGAAFYAVSKTMQAIGSGFGFDSTMQQNTVAFTHFLGSAQAARQELDTLYQIAATTPFEFSDVTTATRRFLAFGFSVGQANDELRIVGDAIAGMGGGAEQINQLVLALGQIKAKGRLQGDELLQLTELGVIGPQQIAAQLNMTTTAFQKAVTAGKISSEQAITAINNVLKQQFAGSAAEQSKTVQGQLSTIRDYSKQTLGALVQPLFDLAGSDVLPKISGALQSMAKSMKDGGAQQFWSAMGTAAKIIGPIIALRGAFALLVKAEAAVAAVSALVTTGFVANGFAALALIPEIASLSDVLFLLAGAFEGTWLAALGPVGWIIAAIIAVIAVATLLYFKWKPFHDLVNLTFSIAKDYFHALVVEIKFVIMLVGKLWDALKGIGGALSKFAGFVTGQGIHMPHIPGIGHMASGGSLRPGQSAIVGEGGAPELAVNRGGSTQIIPLGGGHPAGQSRVLQPLYLQVDGRVFAQVMVDVGQTAAARR